MKMTAAQAIVEIMCKEGIHTAFGIPGAAINPVYKYMEHEYEIENDPLTLNTFIYLAQSNSSTNNKQDFIQ